MEIVIDTGPLVSAINRRDPACAMSIAALGRLGRNAIVPSPVIVEVDHLIRERVGAGAARAFLSNVAGGSHRVAYMTAGLLERAVQLDRHYADLDLGVVDGSVMAVAERHDLPILTFDFRDFRATESATGPWRLAIDEHIFEREIRG